MERAVNARKACIRPDNTQKYSASPNYNKELINYYLSYTAFWRATEVYPIYANKSKHRNLVSDQSTGAVG